MNRQIRDPRDAAQHGEAAAANRWIDRDRAIDEVVLSIRRVGTETVRTHWAAEVVACPRR